jgi:hypothetical protein
MGTHLVIINSLAILVMVPKMEMHSFFTSYYYSIIFKFYYFSNTISDADGDCIIIVLENQTSSPYF